MAGHVAYDALLNVVPAGKDSRLDCQPIVYDRCTRDQVRNGEGDCVDGTEADALCNEHCRTTRMAHYADFQNEDPSENVLTQFGVVSRENGHCQCLHDLHYGAAVLSSSSSSSFSSSFSSAVSDTSVSTGYVDGQGDYVVRDQDGTELERVSASDGTWSQETLTRMYGECPRAKDGGEECRITHVHTNSEGLNMAIVGGLLELDHQDQSSGSGSDSGGELAMSTSRDGRRRLNHAVLETEYNSTVVSPLICVVAGDKIIFTFTYFAWPVPVNDTISSWNREGSPYDTMDPSDFFGQLHTDLLRSKDMAEFEALSTGTTATGAWRSTLKNTVSKMSSKSIYPTWTFQHTFNTEGVYTFGSYQRATNHLSLERFIVVVQPQNTLCSSSISPVGTFVFFFSSFLLFFFSSFLLSLLSLLFFFLFLFFLFFLLPLLYVVANFLFPLFPFSPFPFSPFPFPSLPPSFLHLPTNSNQRVWDRRWDARSDT